MAVSGRSRSGHARRSTALALALAVTVVNVPAAAQQSGAAAGVYAPQARGAAVPAKGVGPSFPQLSGDTPDGTMSPEVKQSIGCLLAGSAGTLAAIGAGGENLVNLVAGGMVSPANPAVLYIGLVGVVFASFCAIGHALTPLFLYYFDDDAVSSPPPRITVPGECPGCRRADGGMPRYPAVGMPAHELRRVAYQPGEQPPAATVSDALAALAGPLAIRH